MQVNLADDAAELLAGLQGFGLTEYESRVYYALLSNGPSTVNHLQYASGVPRTKVYRVAQQLASKGLVRELEGGRTSQPARFEAQQPEALQSILVERERKVKALRRSLVALKKIRERNVSPGDTFQENYLSLGSNSLLARLKESIVRSQRSVRCVVDSWGLSLIQECVEEIEIACRHDSEVLILSSLAETLPEFPFASPRLKVRFGKHFAGKSVFFIDNSEVILVNSQTGRGYQFMLDILRSAMGDEGFEMLWADSTSLKALSSLQVLEGLPFLVEPSKLKGLFIEAVARAIKDDPVVEKVGEELLELLELRVSSKLIRQPFDTSVKVMLALMKEELGDEVSTEYDPLTKIARIEMPDSQEATPASVWYFALLGLLRKSGTANELMQVSSYPQSKIRIIQRRFAGPR